MPLTPVQQAKAYELVIDRLKQAILDGTFPPGSRLPSVKSLSETLGVGQAAIREAISALRVLHLVDVRQGDGTFVSSFDVKEISNSIQGFSSMSKHDLQALLELRIWIETGAARYAAERRLDQHVQEMRQIIERMERELGDAELGEEADWEFHYVIARASRNPYIQSLMDTVSERIQSALLTSRLALYRIPGEDKLLLQQHKVIFTNIEARNADAAMTAVQQHLQHVSIQLLGGEVL